MNEREMNIFLKYFSGMSREEIAAELNTNVNNIRTLMITHGKEWVEFHLKDEYKNKILELSDVEKNTQQIADILGKPWNRYSVQFVVHKIRQIQKTATQATQLRQTPHTFRCARCHRQYQETMLAARLNPDRLCPSETNYVGCIDRRIGERRSFNRET